MPRPNLRNAAKRSFRNNFDDNQVQKILKAEGDSGDTGLRLLARDYKDVAKRNGTSEDDEDAYAELLMFGEIGESWWGDSITGKEVHDFAARNAGRKIKLKVDTPGGDVYDGMVIMNTLMFHDAEVLGEIMGLCYSAGSYAILGCDKVTAHQTSSFGIHPAWSVTVGNQYAHADSIKWLDSIDRMIMDVYEARTGKSAEDIKALFLGEDNDGTVFTAKEAHAEGFIDELIMIPKRNADDTDDDDADDTSNSAAPTVANQVSDQNKAALAALQKKQAAFKMDRYLDKIGGK